MSFFARVSSRLKTRLLTRRQAILLSVFLAFGLAIAFGVHAQDAGSSTNGLNLPGKQVIDYGLAFLGLAFSALAWGIGKLIILVIGMVIIPILGYNGFGSSQVVSIGWALVRDVVNMFVIVLLLLMAVQTMLGIGRIDWRQQLPRFFLAVVAVNFSKTITLFLIDIGQVVMFTFVNALTDIAAGNFINLLQISSFYELSESANLVDGVVESGGYNAVGFLATSWLTVSLLGMVLAVMLLMALIYIYRIVLLWVLIVVSPIAFFAGGVGNTLASFGSQYADWWKRLVGAIALGPILTFFLWLALASASSGGIASSEGFNTTPSDDAVAASGPYVEIFELDRFLSLLLALVLISVGFQAASAQAQAIGGPAASLISEKSGQRLLKGAVAAPGALAYGSGRLGYRGARRAAVGAKSGGAYVGRGVLSELEAQSGLPSKLTQAVAERAAPLAARGGIAGAIGRQVAAPAFALQKQGAAFRQEVIEGAKKRTADYSDTQRFAEYEAVAKGEGAGIGRAGDRAVLESKLATDKGEQKAFKDYLKGRVSQQEGEKTEDFEKRQSEFVDAQFGKAMQRALTNTDKNKDELLGDDKALKDKLFKSKSANLHYLQGMSQKDVSEHIQDEDFKISQLSSDSVKDPRVQQALKDRVMAEFTDSRTGEKIQSTAWDYIKQGRSGTSAAVRDEARKIDEDEGLLRDFGKTRPSEITKRLSDGVMKVQDLKVENLQGANGDAVMQGLIDSVDAGVDIGGMADDARQAFVQKAEAQWETASEAQRNKIDRAMFVATKDPDHLGITPNGAIPPGNAAKLDVAIKADPTRIRHLAPQVQAGRMTGNDVTKFIRDATSGSSIKKMVNQFPDASPEKKAELRQTMETTQNALSAELHRAMDENNKDVQREINQLIDQTKLALREMPAQSTPVPPTSEGTA